MHSESRNYCDFRDCQVVVANDVHYFVHKSACTLMCSTEFLDIYILV